MEEKRQRICSSCRYKFVVNSERNACPQCGKAVASMSTPLLHYVYLHCSKAKRLPDGKKCSERSIRVEDFEQQVDSLLSQIEIPEAFAKWVIKWLKQLCKQDFKEHGRNLREVQKKYNKTSLVIQNLAVMRANNELDADEFRLAKHGLIHDKRRLKQKLDQLDKHTDDWMESVERLFNFAEQARRCFASGTYEQKRSILKSIGSNLTLKDKKLHIEALKPFVILGEIKQSEEYEEITFELEKKPEVSLDLVPSMTEFPRVLASIDAIRAWFGLNMDRLPARIL